ncbi:MAG: hypothetical protein JTT17_01070 [Candidatus Brockarchaeota archaeon]|nr:hypothetical protein [Candidatus Brockarchaeota archaeon]
MNSRLRKRFIDSIEYLRGMNFFNDYSDLSSEEIFERILRGEIGYQFSWWEEDKDKDLHPGLHLFLDVRKSWKSWMKASDFEIDRKLVCFDTKRVVVEDVETEVSDKMGIAILNRLARISRGIFQPMNISSKWIVRPENKWSIQEVSFDFKGERHNVEIVLRYDYIIDMGIHELNELIEDTGYQYYHIEHGDLIMVVVLTKGEAEKLEKERGWRFEWREFPAL